MRFCSDLDSFISSPDKPVDTLRVRRLVADPNCQTGWEEKVVILSLTGRKNWSTITSFTICSPPFRPERVSGWQSGAVFTSFVTDNTYSFRMIWGRLEFIEPCRNHFHRLAAGPTNGWRDSHNGHFPEVYRPALWVRQDVCHNMWAQYSMKITSRSQSSK